MWYKLAKKNALSGYYSGWGNAEWIDPTGENFSTEGGTHQDWMFKNMDYIDEETGLLSNYYEELEESHRERVSEELTKIDEEIASVQQELNIARSQPEPDMEEIQGLEQEIAAWMKDRKGWEASLDDYSPSEDSSISEMVSRLIEQGWVRKIHKSGKLYYEISPGDWERSIKLVQDDIFNQLSNESNRISNDTPVTIETCVRSNLGAPTSEFAIGEFLSSGQSLNDFMEDASSNISYGRSLRR